VSGLGFWREEFLNDGFHDVQILAPRNSYLPLLETDIRDHFARVIPSNSDSIWFDYQGLPLKWYDACDNVNPSPHG
jgi:hypothetical protein